MQSIRIWVLLLIISVLNVTSKISKCTSGPYLYDDSCLKTNYDVKHLLILSHVYDLTVIPNLNCIQLNEEYKNDMQRFFSSSPIEGNDCTADDVTKAIPFTDKQGGDNHLLMFVNVTQFLDLEQEKNSDNDQINKVCHAIQNNEDYMSLVQSFSQGGLKNGNNLFPQMNYYLSNSRTFSKNIVFINRNKYIIDDKMCNIDGIISESNKEKHKIDININRKGFKYGGLVNSINELHKEIKRLRIKLNKFDSRLISKVVQNELDSSFKLWKHFISETRSISCHRNSSIADFASLEDSEKKESIQTKMESKHIPICKNEKGNGNGYEHIKNSHNIHLNLRFSYFLRSLADDMVDKGFSIDVYIVQGPNEKRRKHIEENLKICNIQKENVVWEDGFLIEKLTDEDYSLFKKKFKPAEISVALKHVSIWKKIAEKAKLRSNGIGYGNSTKFSLIVEDDQYLAKNIKLQIVESLLQLPDDVGLINLDDSFFFNHNFYPPHHLLKYPFPRLYERNESRTTGAYLISDTTAIQFINGGHILPFYNPVDFQISNAIKKLKIPTQWIFPPMTCAGSQGLEKGVTSTTGGTQMDIGDRWYCEACCNRYYNTKTMQEIFAFANS
jgi:hypothetical protein